MNLAQTQVDTQHEEYSLTCAKCRHDGGIGIICDGVWYFDSKDAINGVDELSSLFCCTGCISWFRRNARDWFEDDIPRRWFRFTKSEMKNWSRESWIGSEEKSVAFVENIMKKQEDKKAQKNSKKTSRVSSTAESAPAIPVSATVPAPTTPRRKRKRAVDVDTSSTTNFVVERYNPKSTFDSFQRGIKTVYAFLNMCNNTEPTSGNHIPNDIHTILTMQIRLLEGLMQTLQEHITFETK